MAVSKAKYNKNLEIIVLDEYVGHIGEIFSQDSHSYIDIAKECNSLQELTILYSICDTEYNNLCAFNFDFEYDEYVYEINQIASKELSLSFTQIMAKAKSSDAYKRLIEDVNEDCCNKTKARQYASILHKGIKEIIKSKIAIINDKFIHVNYGGEVYTLDVQEQAKMLYPIVSILKRDKAVLDAYKQDKDVLIEVSANCQLRGAVWVQESDFIKNYDKTKKYRLEK